MASMGKPHDKREKRQDNRIVATVDWGSSANDHVMASAWLHNDARLTTGCYLYLAEVYLYT